MPRRRVREQARGKQSVIQAHEPNDAKVRPYAMTFRVSKQHEPSKTVMGGSGDNNDAPLVKRRAQAQTDYPAYLEVELPRDPPPAIWKSASLFCGCGGFDLGFRSAGIGTIYANDIYARAAETFKQNLGHKVDVRDIREVNAAALELGDIDVLTGGFPCVTFSMAGKRAGVEDTINGKLYLELCRLIGELKPRYFVAENVRGILNANGGAAVKLVLAAFLRLGYWTYYELVNMADHGVPQTRERVIFVGVRRDKHRGAFQFPKPSRRRRGDKNAAVWLPLARSLREAVGDLPEPNGRIVADQLVAQNDMLDDQQKHVEARNRRSAQRQPVDPSYTVRSTNGSPIVVADHDKIAGAGPTTWGCSGRGGDGGARGPSVTANAGSGVPMVVANQNQLTGTKQHRYGVANRTTSINEPVEAVMGAASSASWVNSLRRMTVRECVRVQSFPDWFELAGSMSDGYRQVGNAVPPLYAKRLAEALLEYDARDKL